MSTLELLAPAGNMSKLKFAFNYGADAVYLADKKYGLRAYADNFSSEELETAITYAHSIGKKVYVTVNIYADDDELTGIEDEAKKIYGAGADGAIISDLGVFRIFRKAVPDLPLHVSTQANVTNSSAALAWADLGAKRIILARETRLEDICKIRASLPRDVELEAFVHGAMCIAYSGRCLLSSYFTDRSGNKGECVQCCRWEYEVIEKSRNDILCVTEDNKGTYIFSSKDLCMIEHLADLIKAGVSSFKIEGRIKSEYYVAGVVNAYRRALDLAMDGKTVEPQLLYEMEKISHRGYTTGFFYGEKGGSTNQSKPVSTHVFVALVLGNTQDYTVVEMRNRFSVGDELEVLSPNSYFNRTVKIAKIVDESGSEILVADKVQAQLKIKIDFPLAPMDILRKKI